MKFKTLRLSIATVCSLLLLTFAQSAPAQTESLRLGFLTVRTGPLAAGGKQMEDGINLLLKERNNTFAGRKVEIFFADTARQAGAGQKQSRRNWSSATRCT